MQILFKLLNEFHKTWKIKVDKFYLRFFCKEVVRLCNSERVILISLIPTEQPLKHSHPIAC